MMMTEIVFTGRCSKLEKVLRSPLKERFFLCFVGHDPNDTFEVEIKDPYSLQEVRRKCALAGVVVAFGHLDGKWAEWAGDTLVREAEIHALDAD